MQFSLPSALKPVYAKLVLAGGVLLAIGLFSPSYYLSETIDGDFYSLSALGGSLVDRLSVGFFSPLAGFVSLCFALICVILPFVCGRMRLSERSRRKYVAIASSLAGVCGLLSVVYFHSWFDLAYPDGPFFYQNESVSRGLGFGYFLVWFGVVLLFLSAYVSRGFVFEAKR